MNEGTVPPLTPCFTIEKAGALSSGLSGESTHRRIWSGELSLNGYVLILCPVGKCFLLGYGQLKDTALELSLDVFLN